MSDCRLGGRDFIPGWGRNVSFLCHIHSIPRVNQSLNPVTIGGYFLEGNRPDYATDFSAPSVPEIVNNIWWKYKL
jgi:hypothetical protein